MTTHNVKMGQVWINVHDLLQSGPVRHQRESMRKRFLHQSQALLWRAVIQFTDCFFNFSGIIGFLEGDDWKIIIIYYQKKNRSSLLLLTTELVNALLKTAMYHSRNRTTD